jgi:hypothetical protein
MSDIEPQLDEAQAAPGDQAERASPILLFAIPRTGSTNLARVMSGFSDVLSFEEVFHNEALYVGNQNQGAFSNYLKANGLEFDDIYDRRVVGFFKHNLGRAFNLMGGYAAEKGCTQFSVQIFLGHLPSYSIRRLLERRRMPSIVLHRNPIDSFISNVKAAVMEKFEHVDTTDLQVTLNAQRYVDWYNRHAQFYGMVLYYLQKTETPYVVMKYDDIYQDGQPHLSEQLRDKLGGIGVSLGEFHGAKELTKQDRSSDYAKKVANWDEFEGKLRYRGLSGMLDADYI